MRNIHNKGKPWDNPTERGHERKLVIAGWVASAIGIVFLIWLFCAAASPVNAQSYSTYNYGGMYYSSRDTTFQNQNTGGYTYAPPPLRSDNAFIRGIMYILGGLREQAGTRDPYAPADRAGGNGASPPRQQN